MTPSANVRLRLRLVLATALLLVMSVTHCQSSSLQARRTRAELLSSLPSSQATAARRVLNSHGVPPQHRPTSFTPVASAATQQSPYVAPPVPPSFVFSPIAYGADPTGQADSTAAFEQLMSDLLSPNATHAHRMADGIVDLGGATVDLQGGDYLISRPLRIPPCYGNARIMRGSLRASPSFPSDGYLVVVGNETARADWDEAVRGGGRPSRPGLSSAASRRQDFYSLADPAGCRFDQQAVYMEDVQLLSLLLDCQHAAAGGVFVSYIMGGLIGDQTFIIGCPLAGITSVQGHELVISTVWVAEYFWDDPHWRDAKSEGVQIFGNDNIIQNVIVFSARVGLHIIGAANLVYGLHSWNLGESQGGVGLFMDCAGYTQNRVIASYLDYNDLVAVSPEHLVVNECFFLSTAAIVLQSDGKYNTINGMTLLSNVWDSGEGGRAAIRLNETLGAFTSLTDTFIDQNMVSRGYGLQGSAARFSAEANFSSGIPACFNLSSRLLFPQFRPQHVQATFVMSGSTQQADGLSWWVSQLGAAKADEDQRVLCVTVDAGSGRVVHGELHVDVDQSTTSQPRVQLMDTAASLPAPAAAAPAAQRTIRWRDVVH